MTLQHTKPLPDGATVELPLLLTLEWYVADMRLSDAENEIFDKAFNARAREFGHRSWIPLWSGRHTAKPGVKVRLPFRAVLDWFMMSDPSPLKHEDDEVIREILEARSIELGFDGWVDAYHEGGTVPVG